MKKVMIIGSTGLIGREIVKCIDSDKYDIYAPGSSAFNLFDKGNRREYLQNICPDILIHAAWITTGDYLSNPLNWEWKKNSLELFQEFMDCGGKQIISLGTCFEYDFNTNGKHIKEDWLLNPTTEYAKSKVALFQETCNHCRERGVQFIWGRVFYAYGVFEKEGRLLRSSIDSFTSGKQFVVKYGQLERDYVFSKDIAKMILMLIESDYFGPINLCTGNALSLGELISGISMLMGKTELVNVHYEKTDQPFSIVGDNSLFNKVIGEYEPISYLDALKTILIEEGIR